MSTPIVELHHLGKEFRSDFWKKPVRVLRDVSFQVHEGDLFGLIGPNGAGKTTTLKILIGLISPTEGEATIPEKRWIGFLPENAYYYDYLTAEEILDFYGRLFGLSREKRRAKTDELLEWVGLSEWRGVRLRNFSKGMLQRIGIAQALVNDPKLVILDEPMSGLDPIGRKEVRDIILRLSERGKTVIFSSHILSDVESICERVAILVRGELRACGAMEELVRPQLKSVEVSFLAPGDPSLPRAWQGEVTHRRVGNILTLHLPNGERLEEILDWGRTTRLSLQSVAPQRESLEDIFLAEVGRKS